MSGSGHRKSNDTTGPSGFGDAVRTVDASGLHCPDPLVLCRQAMSEMASGMTIHIIATDPHAEIDFEVFARRSPHELVRSEWVDDRYHALLRLA